MKIHAVDEKRQKQIHIVIWTETHFREKHRVIFEQIAGENNYNTYSITRSMKRYDKGSGGVTIMVDKQIQSTYLVPESSSRNRKAEQLVEE